MKNLDQEQSRNSESLLNAQQMYYSNIALKDVYKMPRSVANIINDGNNRSNSLSMKSPIKASMPDLSTGNQDYPMYTSAYTNSKLDISRD